MMRCLLVLLLTLPAFATEVKIFSYSDLKDMPSSIKEWKGFETTKGFSLKMPTCWEVENADYDFSGPPEKSGWIRLKETKACARPKFYHEVSGPNTMGIEIFPLAFKTEEEKQKDLQLEIKLVEKSKKSSTPRGNRDRPFAEYIKTENQDIIASVQNAGKGILRWSKVIYCKNLSKIRLTGPVLSNPHPEFFDRFQKGELSMPEPEKTISESVRCR